MLEHALCFGAEWDLDKRRDLRAGTPLLQLFAEVGKRKREQESSCMTSWLAHQAKQQVLRLDRGHAEPGGLEAGKEQRSPRWFVVTLKHVRVLATRAP
jgi:hypothetical protein